MARVTTPAPPIALVVLESFVTDVDGVPVAYRKGEPVDPRDPVVRKHAKAFGPLVFPHSVRTRLTTPEVRAD